MKSLNTPPVHHGYGIYAETLAATLPTTCTRKYYSHFAKRQNPNCNRYSQCNSTASGLLSDCTTETVNRSFIVTTANHLNHYLTISLMTANHTPKKSITQSWQRPTYLNVSLNGWQNQTTGRGGMSVCCGRNTANFKAWQQSAKHQVSTTVKSAQS